MVITMYAYIHGRLDTKRADSVVVEAGGVGYLVYTALSTLARLPASNSDVKLYTHFVVREDAHTLYGFMSRDELGMFETLLTVSGVGPKAALALLSAVSPSQFGLAVLNEDYKLLTRAQGVGAKLAQKIVFELRDKMRKELSGAGGAAGAAGAAGIGGIGGIGGDAGIFGGADGAGAGAGGEGGASLAERSRYSEAVEALIVLGCTAIEANGIVSRVYSDGMEIEDIIRKALQEIGRY